ncbi:ABC transporter permease [Paenibacillus chitinolyticus]|uniref:ABC transporter permease n=1 Tax=Paenibacillus chitinolyticus TaxID=79263 RepID=UPI0035E09B34
MIPLPLKVGSVIAEEWRQIFKDRRLMAILFLVPILYTTLFGSIYIQHKVTEMQTVVFDEDNSQLSRQIVQAFDQSETFRVVNAYHSEAEVTEAISRGEAKVGVIIPKEFEARIKHGDVQPVMTLIDGANMMISNSATRAANEIVTTYSYGVSGKKLQQQGLQDEQVSSTFSAVPFRYRVLYNPTFNYSDFMIFGLAGAILQQVLLLGIALTITRDKEKGIWSRFAEWKKMPWRLAYAKSVPYFIIGMLNAVVVFTIMLFGFDLPMRGQILMAMLLSACFNFAVLGIGYFISLFSSAQLGSTQIAMLIAVPSFMLSGYTWPFEAMPKALSILGHLLPLTYFLEGVRHVFVKGNGYDVIVQDCIALVLTGLITYFAAFLLTRFAMFRKQTDEPASAGLPAVQQESTSLTV